MAETTTIITTRTMKKANLNLKETMTTKMMSTMTTVDDDNDDQDER